MHKLIVLEGVDGSGKSSLCEKLVERLAQNEKPAVYFEQIRDRSDLLSELKKKVVQHTSLETQFYFFLTSAVHKSERLRELLKTQTVVLDRFVHSIFAHHIAHGLNPQLILPLDKLAIVQPNHVLHITVPEHLRIQRVTARGGADQQDFEPAVDTSTVAGRKLAYFRSAISDEIDNSHDGHDRAIAQILAIIGT